jgi:tRNA A-37 threonylcarbamoyl transferase component Bud32
VHEEAERRALLIELVHEDLEYRLKAGEAMRVERYLERYPELAGDRHVVLDLLQREYQLRRSCDPEIRLEEYLRRFPQQAEALPLRLEAPSGEEVDTVRQVRASQMPSRLEKAKAVSSPATPVSSQEVASWPPIPGYEILGELGRGGMGVVYKSRQVKLNRVVALKMILAGAYAGPEELARFRAEAEAIARLQHPNIVQIYEVGENGGRPFFALEFVEGGSLDTKLAGGPLPPREAAGLVEVLARAVHAAHRRGIVHRDLKPANVLLTADGTPKIADFGLAKRLDRATPRTQSGAVLGTPCYMAPEQARGRTKAVGPAADVYALGAILYELLTGRPPFRAETASETLLEVMSLEPVPPRRWQPNLPRDLETICLKCLQKEIPQRYPSAEALAEDLRRLLKDEPIRARPAGRTEKLWRWCRRNRAVAALTGVVAFLLLGMLMLGLEAYRRAASHSSDGAAADELPQVIAELDLLDPGWRLEQLEAERKRQILPDDQNASLRVEAVKRLLPPDWHPSGVRGSQQLQDTVLRNLPPNVKLREEQTASLAAVLQKMAPALAEARPLTELRHGYHPVSWSHNAIETLLPYTQGSRSVAGLLELDAVLRAQKGEFDGAINSCRGILNAGRSIGDEPFLISQIVRIACVTLAIRTLERVLGQGEPSAVALAAIEELLEEEARHPALLVGARGDRGGIHWAMMSIEAGDMKVSQLLDEGEKLPEEGEPPASSVRAAHAWSLRHMTQLVTIARRPSHEQQQAMAEWDEALQHAPRVSRLLAPKGKSVRFFLGIRAEVRSAIVAVAADRYRQAYGRWPETAAALVPRYLPEVPADPYDGAPLRYRRLEDGLVIYAVGWDRKDNQGTLDYQNPNREGADVGFRLWDVRLRRQVPAR